MRCVEPSPAFATLKMVSTPPGPGGVDRSRPPTLAAVSLATEPLRMVAFFTGDGPAGAAELR